MEQSLVVQPPFDPVRIFVSRAGMSNNLRLRDNRNNRTTGPTQGQIDTEVDPANVIIWELDPDSLGDSPKPGFFPIQSIDNVVQTFPADDAKYTGSEPVLTSNPVQAGNIFIAQVLNPSPGKGKFATYRIDFTLPDGTKHSHDPKIVLNS